MGEVTGQPASSGRAARVQAAVRAWTDELVDLSGRNALLYYRDLKQGTLDLGPDSAASGVVVEQLLASHKVRLSTVFADSVGAAARRARVIRAKAVENFEERGLQTLFLTWGMATWANPKGKSTPAAPVLLRQAALEPRGGLAEDFDVSLPGEWEVNPTLLHLLRTEYGIELNPGELLELLDQDAQPPDPALLFERMVKASSDVAGFAVRPRVVLGNFSYAKLPMVSDLQTATDTLVGSDLIAAIAGDEQARSAIRSRHPNVSPGQPDHIPPMDEFLVLDADASQSYAINCAVSGADLVIEGPPGTGKSQTIANLIATLSACGKRVLFVAEKRAAIDAVLDRLRKAGLDDLVLDLHDGAGSRRKLAAELARTLAMTSSIAKPDLSTQHETLTRHRRALTERTHALHQRRDPCGLSVYDLYAGLAAVPATATSTQRFPSPVLARLDGATYRAVRADLETFVNLGGFAISEANSPWAGAFEVGTITTADQARDALDAARTLSSHTLPATASRLEQAVAECGLPSPRTVEEWIATLALLNGVAETLAVFDPAVFDAPLNELAAALAPGSGGRFTRLRAAVGDGGYRAARKSAAALWKQGKLRPEALHSAVVAAAGQLAAWRSQAQGGQPRLPSDLPAAAGSLSQLQAELQALAAWAGTAALVQLSLPELADRLRALLADAQTVAKLPELARVRAALQAAGTWHVLEEFRQRNLTTDQALTCLDHIWLSSILDSVSLADPRIGAFDGQAHSRTAAGFAQADRDHIATTAVRIKRAVAENVTRVRDAYPAESDVVQHQARLKRGHLPVRRLFEQAPHVLAALRPCWAMSPLVVAQLLPAQRVFDIVIFDEASQVTPADAVGALMRADRAVVAGDPHQLPPTSFFGSSGGGEDDEDADDTELGGTRNMESILDAMGALLPPPKGTRTLGWHYRSKDERLIAFSNAQPSLYDWSLTTFPGVAGPECLTHVPVPFQPGRPGQEDSASAEVTRVVELIAEHARTRPGESLGVIAMGIKHANRISESLRRARAADPDLDAFLSGNASEQARKELYFVKNLERVQGDERDAIILTVGYGKNPEGRMLYRFGPINNEGGERRLNVAITRARSRMTVVSSFSAADMDPNHLRAEGAKMLHRYLAYAESGGSDLGHVAKAKDELNPFERDVQTHLANAGIPLIPQFGCSGYWIDFAAQHPTQPGRMVLAIEADGATYHSSATARDRDRLRQDHLERLGWTFHRIWSQDWFYHREAEVARAVAAYQAAVTAADACPELTPGGVPTPGGASAGGAVRATAATPHRAGPCPIWTHRAKIEEYSPAELVTLIQWIKSDTLLRTEDELLAEAVRALGFQRKGPRIVAALTTTIANARYQPPYEQAAPGRLT